MLRLIAAVCALVGRLVGASETAKVPPLPPWGSGVARDFVVTVNLTAHDVVTTGASWVFEYKYSGGHDADGAKNVSIYRH